MSAVRVAVALEGRSYEVLIGEGLIAGAGAAVAPFAPGGRVFVVTDETVAGLHRAALEASLAAAGLKARWLVLAPGEETKSWEGLRTVCDWALSEGIERRDVILAFGGGVIGDLAGLAAGLLKRGVDFVQIPTTLLAQVDSSVGGKTAIDTSAGKNMVGLFYQPRLVLADMGVLATLPPRERLAGYAEIVKYGLIDDAPFFSWCEINFANILAGDPAALAYAVEASVRAKARVVAADEREAGARALLNLGHTFAHAFEAEAGFDGALLHGEAVGTGMAKAFAFSQKLGLCDPSAAWRAIRHLEEAGFNLDLKRLPGAPFSPDALITHMRQDKKAEAGALTLILVKGIGQAFVQKQAPEAALRAFLEEELTP